MVTLLILGATNSASDQQDLRGNTSLDAISGTISFALVFGCSPSTGVIAKTRFMYDVADSFFSGCAIDMTCTFPDVLESLQGTDNNFEMVTSSTLRPLKMFYEHNVVRILRGYVFAQEGLEGFGNWTGNEIQGHDFIEAIQARVLSEKVRYDLMDPETTNIPEVELFINKTKAETIQVFHDIQQLGEKIKRE